MVKRLFLGNWAELIAMTTKYPWVQDVNQFISQNTTARYGSLIFADSTLMYNVSFKQFSKLCSYNSTVFPSLMATSSLRWWVGFFVLWQAFIINFENITTANNMFFFFSKMKNYFIGLQQDLNFIVFSFFCYCFVPMAFLQFMGLSQLNFSKK